METEEEKFDEVLSQFEQAMKRFDDVLHQEKNEYIRDSAIQRFEFTFDLCWKAIKGYLEDRQGIVCHSPKSCFRAAYQQGLIEYDDFWNQIADLRNKTAHMYKEAMAEGVFAQLPKVFSYFQTALTNIKKEMS